MATIKAIVGIEFKIRKLPGLGPLELPPRGEKIIPKKTRAH